MKSVLEADSIRLSFGTRRILSDVYLKLEAGQVMGLLGRNGSGKSSLLKMIFGSQRGDSGNIRVDGKRYARPFTSKRIAYLPQHPFLPAGEKVAWALDFFLDDKEAALKLAADERIGQAITRRIGTLSGGMRRYLETALVLNLGADFILLDEPFSGLEPLYREAMKSAIRAAAAAKGILVTDHDYLNILDVSGRIGLISNGKLIEIKDRQELRDHSFLPDHGVPGTPKT